MPKYNPNSIWESKKKEALYTPPEKPQPPARPQPVAKPPLAARLEQVKFNDDKKKNGYAFLWSAIVLIVIAGAITLYFFMRPTVGPNVGITFAKPDQVLLGDPFTLTVTLSNYSSNILKGANLSVILPSNISFVGQPANQTVMEQTIGDLGPGSITGNDFQLIVTGDPNSVQHIDVKLVYATDASPKAQFETDGGVDLVVGGPAISLNFSAPQDVFSGQDFDTVITYTNNTSHSFNNAELVLQYPPVFSFIRSTMPSGTPSNNSWNLGTIPAAGTGSFTLTGNIVGPANALYAFAGTLTGDVMGETYDLTSQTADFAIGSSPLSLMVTLNDNPDYVAYPGNTLSYIVNYTNSSNVTFTNAKITATLVGAMFDLGTLESDGSFNSITNTLTWNGGNTPQLLDIPPGGSGSVTFQLRALQSYPIRLLSDKNYTLKVNAQISSPTVPPGTSASSTIFATSVKNKVGGAIVLSAKGLWRDASSGILNSGPYPPKVNQPTEYTIHWIITNYATDANNVTVSAYLQSGTTCTGQIKSNVSTAPICNATNGLVTWNIPQVPATTGITDPPAEAIIQVTNTPAVNQVGSAVTLMGPSTLQATDGFTSSTLQSSASAITTDLPDDTTINQNQSRNVTQ